MSAAVKVGDRIKLLAPMTNPNSTCRPVEDDMPVGLEGVVTGVLTGHGPKFDQISVHWDNGRMLGVMPGHDKFQIIPVEANNP